jgi:hypothetical protein
MNTGGYPDEQELERIRTWPLNEASEFDSLMAYIREQWVYAETGYWVQRRSVYRLATGGWSGNEEIIRAMRGNGVFWGGCFLASISGGLHLFCTNPSSGLAQDLLQALQTATRWPLNLA